MEKKEEPLLDDDDDDDEDFLPEDEEDESSTSNKAKLKRTHNLLDTDEQTLNAKKSKTEVNDSTEQGQDTKNTKIANIWEEMKKAEDKPQKEPTAPASPTSSSSAQEIKVSQTYDFAGEKIKVTKIIAIEQTKKKGNLDSILGGLKKNQKMSTLEKSKLDWSSFKEKEGIEDELHQHLKSKNSYLDKQAFLQRADLKQFEKEKEVRLASRKPTSFG